MATTTATPSARRVLHVRWSHRSPFGRHVADAVRLTAVTSVLMLGMTALIGLMWTAIGDQIGQLAESMPQAVLAMVGGADMSTPVGWMDGEVGSLFAPFVVAGVAIVLVGRSVGQDVEGHTLDLVLSAPVGRARLLATKLAAVWGAVVVLDLAILVGYVLAARLGRFELPAEGLAAITVQTTLLGWFAAAVTAVAAVLTGQRRRAIAVASGVVGAAYVVASFLPQYDAVAGLARLSPWYAFNAGAPFATGFTPVHTVALALVAAGTAAVAVVLFVRRDLPG